MRIALPLRIALGIVLWLGAAGTISAQTAGCVLVVDPHGPDRILRCGVQLTIHATPEAHYLLTGGQGKKPPTSMELDSGAVRIEFVPSSAQRNFQVLTPHAIAAVRGTSWAVDVTEERTATLAISGAVEVRRRLSSQAAILHAGEGADVSGAMGPIDVKRWKIERVRALLGRFSR